MKNIFTWVSGVLAGSIAGFICGIGVIAWSVAIDPDGMIHICEKHKK